MSDNIIFRDAILLLGPAGGGKTTLANYMCEDGAGPYGDQGTNALTLVPAAYSCHLLSVSFLDSRGMGEISQHDSVTLVDILRHIRAHMLRIRLVLIFVTDTAVRAHERSNRILELISSLHPDMRSRVRFWVTSNISLAILARHFPSIPATRVPYDAETNTYSFDRNMFVELLRDPLPPVWEVDRCTRCGVRDDRRLAVNVPCMAHTPYQKDHVIVHGPGTTTTSNAGHDIYHPGHFRGLFYSNTYSCCGYGGSGCRCRVCGCPPSAGGGICKTTVTTTPGARSCTRTGCPGLTSNSCISACSSCENLNAPGCTAGNHNWVSL